MFRGKSKRVHAEGHGRGLVELLPWNCCCRDGLLCVCFCPSQETKAPLSSAALFPGITNLSSEEKRWQRGKVDAAPFDYTLPLSDYILCSVTVLCTCPRQAWTFRRKTPNTWERVFLVMLGYVEFQSLFADARWRRELEKLWRSVRFWWDYDEFVVKHRSLKMENGERDRKLFFEYRNFLFNLSNEQWIATKSSLVYITILLSTLLYSISRD